MKNKTLLALLLTVVFIALSSFFLLNANSDIIFWELRLPTLLLACLTGASLSLAGFRLQNIFQNDLTSPYTLGISSACALGAGIAEVLSLPFIITVLTSCLIGLSLILLFWKLFRRDSKAKIILAGVAMSFLFSSILMLVQFHSSSWNVYKVTQWLMGSIQTVGFDSVKVVLVGFLILFIDSLIIHKKIDLYSLGPDFAINKNLNIARFELHTIIIVSLATSVTISITGPIGFVGLMIPHLSRRLVNSLSLPQIMSNVLMGSILMVLCLIINVVGIEQQVPIGILTSSIGSIFFFILLLRYN